MRSKAISTTPFSPAGIAWITIGVSRQWWFEPLTYVPSER